LLLVLAVLAAILWVPSPWGVLLFVAAAAVEVAEVWFWLWWTKRRKPVIGAEALVGAVATATTALDPDGRVRVQGELWQARSEPAAATGERVVIRAVEPDLTLVVTPEQAKDRE
jgi:membrane protein implicated in regulation of membrane protease activity